MNFLILKSFEQLANRNLSIEKKIDGATGGCSLKKVYSTVLLHPMRSLSLSLSDLVC